MIEREEVLHVTERGEVQTYVMDREEAQACGRHESRHGHLIQDR